jgi:putative membrane protein
MRLVRAARVSALVTGLGDANRRGQLVPLGPRTEAWALVRRLVADPGPLRRHPAAARRRRLVRALSAGLALTAAGAVATALAGAWGVLVAGIVLTVLGVPLGLGRYAALGHAAGWCGSRPCWSAARSSAGECGSRSSSGGRGWPR